MGAYIVRAYIILENNKDTQELVGHLRGKDDGTITIVDEDFGSGLRRKDGLTYVGKDYVKSVQDMDLPFVYYHHIKPVHRRNLRKWRRSLSSMR